MDNFIKMDYKTFIEYVKTQFSNIPKEVESIYNKAIEGIKD